MIVHRAYVAAKTHFGGEAGRTLCATRFGEYALPKVSWAMDEWNELPFAIRCKRCERRLNEKQTASTSKVEAESLARAHLVLSGRCQCGLRPQPHPRFCVTSIAKFAALMVDKRCRRCADAVGLSGEPRKTRAQRKSP